MGPPCSAGPAVEQDGGLQLCDRAACYRRWTGLDTLGKEDGVMGCAMEAVGERLSGEGTWNREARRVALLAAELGVVLNKETLILCDVRDLMSLRLCLQRALSREARRPWG